MRELVDYHHNHHNIYHKYDIYHHNHFYYINDEYHHSCALLRV